MGKKKKAIAAICVVAVLLFGTWMSSKIMQNSYDFDGSVDSGVSTSEVYSGKNVISNTFDMAVDNDSGTISTDVSGNTVKENVQKTDKKIYRGNLQLESVKFQDAYDTIHTLSNQYKAYFESDSVGALSGYLESDSYRTANMTIRIPAEYFTEFMNQIDVMGTVAVVNKNVYVDDVSESYYDIENRLESAKTKLTRLQKLMDEATNMTDIIEIENAISDAEYMVEYLQGQLQSYDSQIAYSYVNIRLTEVTALTMTVKAVGYGHKLVESFTSGFTNGVEFFGNIILKLVQLWFVLLVVLVCIFVGRKVWKIRKAKRAIVQPCEKEIEEKEEP